MQKILELKGITRDDYQNWRHHPVTKVLHQFLKDHHVALKVRAWDLVLGDPKADLGELVGRAKALLEIVDLPFESMFSFYQQEETDAAEVN